VLYDEIKSIRTQILDDIMNQLAVLRRTTLSLPNQEYAAAALEALDYYQQALPTFKNPRQFVQECGRALTDIHHDVVSAKYGYDTPEADAEFEAGQEQLNRLIRYLHSAGSLEGWFVIWKHRPLN
jgi:hypothetical protein